MPLEKIQGVFLRNQSYIKSFEQTKNSDVLLSIPDVIQEKRGYTMAAIDIAITQGLLVWDINSGKLHARELEKRPGRGKNLKRLMETDGQKAEILGKWFAQHDCSAIAAYLKVVL
ncbi:MAG: DUF6521 family protein [Elusimicrobiales bacterium]|nr:DUF6521 family protein [Elusimicrobiales bacterium]